MPRIFEDYTKANEYDDKGRFPSPHYGRGELTRADWNFLLRDYHPAAEKAHISMYLKFVYLQNIACLEKETAALIQEAFGWLEKNITCTWMWNEYFDSNNGCVLDISIFIEDPNSRAEFIKQFPKFKSFGLPRSPEDQAWALGCLKGLIKPMTKDEKIDIWTSDFWSHKIIPGSKPRCSKRDQYTGFRCKIASNELAHEIRVTRAANIVGLQPENVFTFRFTRYQDNQNFRLWLREREPFVTAYDEKSFKKLIFFRDPDVKERFINDWVETAKARIAEPDEIARAFETEEYKPPEGTTVYCITYKPERREPPEWLLKFVKGEGEDRLPIRSLLEGRKAPTQHTKPTSYKPSPA